MVILSSLPMVLETILVLVSDYFVASGSSVLERFSSKKLASRATCAFRISAGQRVLKCLARLENLGYPRSGEGR